MAGKIREPRNMFTINKLRGSMRVPLLFHQHLTSAESLSITFYSNYYLEAPAVFRLEFPEF